MTIIKKMNGEKSFIYARWTKWENSSSSYINSVNMSEEMVKAFFIPID